MEKVSVTKRHNARKFALQALYQWHISGHDLSEIETQFHQDQRMDNVDTQYFHELIHQVPEHLHYIEKQITPHIDRPIEEISLVELTIMRIACYELHFREEVPYKVAINEAIKLTKQFGTIEGYKYVNGVLDKVAQIVRKGK